MDIGLVGRKCGMTRLFDENGTAVAVSVVEIEPNLITQIKSVENDGYCAIQITTGERRASRVNNPVKGHYAKAGVTPGRGLWEFRLENGADLKVGDVTLEVGKEIPLQLFQEGQIVDVQGVTRGKGFAGVVKRYHFRMQDATHGNSLSHRAPGSIGQRQTPGRVFKGKKMAGHLGDDRRTIQNLKIVKIDAGRNLLLIQGAIPGSPGGEIIVLPAVKRKVRKENNDGA